MPRKPSRITIKRIFQIGSVVSLGGITATVTVNKDLRTQITKNITNVTEKIGKRDTTVLTKYLPGDTVRPPPEVEYVVDPELNMLIQSVVAELRGEFIVMGSRARARDSLIGARQEQLADQIRELSSRAVPRPLIYVVIDSVLTPVDPDTIKGAAGWLELLYPNGLPGKARE